MDKDMKVRLASFLEGCDIICPPSTESGLSVSIFLFAHRSVVGEGLCVRRRHPWKRRKKERGGQAGK